MTNVGSCNQVIENHKNGLIVDKENPETLAEGFLYLIKHKEHANKYGSLLKRTVKEDFSKETYIKHVIDIYRLILNEQIKEK